MSEVVQFPRRPGQGSKTVVSLSPRPSENEMIRALATHDENEVYEYINAQAGDCQDYLYGLLFVAKHRLADDPCLGTALGARRSKAVPVQDAKVLAFERSGGR